MGLDGLGRRAVTRRSTVLGCATTGLGLVLAACNGAGEKEPNDASTSSPGAPERATVSDATTGRRDSEFARMLEEGSISSIRLIGDSITAGFGCDGYGAITDRIAYAGPYGEFYESAPTVECWANDLRAHVSGRGVGGFVNAGVSGAKMWWLAEDPDAWVREGADAIFVMLGTNDAVYSTEDEYRANAEVALSAVEARSRHMVVMAPPANERLDASNLLGADVLESVLRGLAEGHGWSFVSMLDSIELHTDLVHEDQCHPTSKGSHAMWEYLRAALGL